MSAKKIVILTSFSFVAKGEFCGNLQVPRLGWNVCGLGKETVGPAAADLDLEYLRDKM